MDDRQDVKIQSGEPDPADGYGVTASLSARWLRPALVLMVGLVALCALFWPTAWSMPDKWLNDDTFSHGILILPVCIFLLWRRRARLAAAVPQPSLLGVLAMVLSALLWLFGHVADILLVEQFALVSMANSLILAVLGWPVIRIMIFPLFYLYFMVPAGAQLVPFLQDLTADKTVWLLRLSGIPVYLDGIFLYIPDGTFEVAEACAGVRFLITSVAIGVLGANLFYKSWWRRALFIGLSIIVPIVANFFRAYGIVMIAHLSDFKHAVGADHLTFGLIFLTFVIICLLALGATFREHHGEDDNSGGAPMMPVSGGPMRSAPLGAFLLVCAGSLLFAGGTRAYSDYSSQQMISDVVPTRFPVIVEAPWKLVESGGGADWKPRFAGSDAQFKETYSNGEQDVYLFIAYYAYQRQGAELINTQNKFGRDRGWQRLGSGRSEAVVDGAPMEVRSTRLVKDFERRLVWSWYWVDGQFTADPYVAKLLQAKAQIMGDMPAAAVIAVATDYELKPNEAKPLLRSFLENIEPLGSKLERAARAGSPTAEMPDSEPDESRDGGES